MRQTHIYITYFKKSLNLYINFVTFMANHVDLFSLLTYISIIDLFFFQVSIIFNFFEKKEYFKYFEIILKQSQTFI